MSGAAVGPSRLLSSAASSVATGWRWWLAELADMLPRRLSGRPGDAVIVTAGSDGSLVGGPSKRTGGKTIPAALRLPSELVLARTVTLAAAAEENLAEVISFQLDRFTPFEPEEVYLGCRVVARDPDAEAIVAAFAVACRADVDALVERMARQGLACVTVIAPEGAWLPSQGQADLALDIARPATSDASSGRLSRVLWLIAAGLAIACVAVPLLRGRAQLAETQRELAAMRLEAHAVAQMREEVEQRAEQAAIPIQRAQRTPLSVLITELTRLVPDGGWVTQLEIDTASVQLTGYATAANALIPALESSPILTNAAFRSPVTQDPVHGVEQFHLSVDLRSRNE